MKAKKKATFICFANDTVLKVVCCVCANNARPEFLGMEVQALPAQADEKKWTALWQQAFKKLGYDHHPIVISLPRNQATCRTLKIPAVLPQEIEKMSNLQASRYLPYPANELVTAFDVISADKEGYSHINLTIVHKNNIERILKILKEFKALRISIVLSSYALVGLYNAIKPGDNDTAMIIDVDSQQAELAIVSSKKLLFSRSVKLNRDTPGWVSLLFDEVDKTRDTYMESATAEALRKFALAGVGGVLDELKVSLEARYSLPVEILSLGPKINLPQSLSNSILNSGVSFASLLGLCLKEAEGSLNLLPQNVKDEAQKLSRRKKGVQAIVFVLVIILTWGIGLAKHLDNKAMYLARLKSELGNISQQAKPLEDIERRFGLLEAKALSRPNSLDILHELHRIVPAQVTLISLGYEENKRVLLRGQSPELSFLLAFVGQMEKSSVFKPFHIKVRYATKKKISSGDMVDFEIECLKK
ncbi:MAG: pilus assembly protein PilM [Candidatus Omnitrophota bacterium]